MKEINKRCPRCNAKLMTNAVKCASCGFNFTKLEQATCSGAKLQRKAGNKENIILTTTRPKDVRRKNFLVLFWLFGWLGVYNFYVGKTTKGLISLICFALCFISFTIYYFNLGEVWSAQFMYCVTAPCITIYCVSFIYYVSDIISLIFHRFKYAVSIPPEEVIDNFVKEK